MCHSGHVCLQGIVSFAGKAHQVMLQGVHELYELNETPQLWEENPRINRLVFIGARIYYHIHSQAHTRAAQLS